MADNMNVSRRAFVGTAGAALAGTVFAGAALADEAATEEASAADVVATPGEVLDDNAVEPETDGLLYTASINPQDYSYRTNSIADFTQTTLFSTWNLGKIELHHRMVKSAAGSATYLAGLTDELFQYYLNFAKGGVEMIWMENIAALEPDAETGEITPEALDFGQRLVAAVAEYGAHLGYQWAPFGSSVAEDAMTVDQIHAIQQNGLNIARGLSQMGFEAIEMNAAGFNQGESS